MLDRLLVVFLLSVTLFVNAFAEDDRGRLTDGRAFRTDAQGMQLVDYIAELEVTIDELKRRVHGLQYEVEEKEDIISALKRNGGTTPSIVEKDLLTQKAANEILAVPLIKQQCPAPEPCPDSFKRGGGDCSQAVSSAKKEVALLTKEREQLQKTLTARNEMLSSYKKLVAKNSQHADSQVPLLQSQLLQKEEESQTLLASLGKVRAELEATKEKNKQVVSKLDALRDGCQVYQEEMGLLNAKLTDENTELREQFAELQKELATSKENLVEAKSAAEKEKNTTERASLSTRSLEQLSTARSELQTLFNRTRGMVYERDKRYKLLMQSSGRSLRVEMSSLRSERGMTLKAISEKIRSVPSLTAASALRRDLLDIQRLVKTDIKLIGRMNTM